MKATGSMDQFPQEIKMTILMSSPLSLEVGEALKICNS